MIINRNTETLKILDTDIHDVYFLAQSVNSSRNFTKLGLNLCCPAERQLARNSQKADFGNFMFHLEDDWVDQTLGNILHEAKVDLLSNEC